MIRGALLPSNHVNNEATVEKKRRKVDFDLKYEFGVLEVTTELVVGFE